MIDLPLSHYQQAVEAITQCGVPAANISIPVGSSTFIPAIMITTVGDATPDRFRCVAGAVRDIQVIIDDEAQNLAYWKLIVDDGRAEVRAEAETWLNAHNLLATLPRYGGNQAGLGPLLRAIERHCEVEGGPVLELTDVGSEQPAVTFNPALFEGLLRNGPQRVHICLSYGLTAAGLPEADIQVPSLPFRAEVLGAQ